MYLNGREIPPLYVTYYWAGDPTLQHVSVLAMPLETALQQIVGNPALALPRSGGMATGHTMHMAPPVGQAIFLEKEVEQWLQASGIQRLHATYHKVCKAGQMH